MANVNAPYGFKVIGNYLGSPWTGRPREYIVDASDSNPLFIGDLVTKSNVSGATMVVDAYGVELPIITLAGATDTPVGVVVGFKADPNNLTLVYKPASTQRTALVCDDPNVLLEIQTDGTAANTWAYKLANIKYAAGTQYYATSRTVLDSTTVASTGTVLKIMGLAFEPQNSLGLYANLICKFQLHEYK